jgi:hypothetical protein
MFSPDSGYYKFHYDTWYSIFQHICGDRYFRVTQNAINYNLTASKSITSGSSGIGNARTCQYNINVSVTDYGSLSRVSQLLPPGTQQSNFTRPLNASVNSDFQHSVTASDYEAPSFLPVSSFENMTMLGKAITLAYSSMPQYTGFAEGQNSSDPSRSDMYEIGLVGQNIYVSPKILATPSITGLSSSKRLSWGNIEGHAQYDVLIDGSTTPAYTTTNNYVDLSAT